VEVDDHAACCSGRPRRVRAAAHAVRRRADFGISRITADGADDASTICGTPKWIAPEVRRSASERY
jgi:serine/threonine protein kinase